MFKMIAAMDQKNGIGKSNDLPWHLPSDFKHFVKETKGHAVIMGRKTWESLPEKFKPLPGRLNIVITRNKEYELPEGVPLASTLDEALQLAKAAENPSNEKPMKGTFVIGGAMIYKLGIEHLGCSELILTEIDATFDCDSFFPQIPESFTPSPGPWQEENNIRFRFVTYQKQ